MSRRGVVGVGGEDYDHDHAPSPYVLLNARARPTGHVSRPARQAEPSWGRVLVSTVKLAVLRGLRAAGLKRRRAGGSRPWHTRGR